jgi:hypothetical protein
MAPKAKIKVTDQVEYKVLQPLPESLEENLNQLAEEGWRVITAYGSWVILERDLLD